MIQPGVTVVIDGRHDVEKSWESLVNLKQYWRQGDRLILLVTGSIPTDQLPCPAESLEVVRFDVNDIPRLKQIFEKITTQFVAYIPTGLVLSPIPSELPDRPCLLVWVPTIPFPSETALASPDAASAWIISTSLLKQINHLIQKESGYRLLNLAELLQAEAINFSWCTASHSADTGLSTSKPSESINRRVLAVIPHYGCERWLTQCLRSLLDQTQSLDNIVVIDDASANAPVDIVSQFPTITLLAAPERSGPYRLVQQVIDDTEYSAYLFQDADDWSSCDRLEKLLSAMDATGCELVGTQELRAMDSELVPVCYPLDVNMALSEKPGHGLLHPTSLVTRDLVMRLGGFATGLQFGGDTEFLLRAVLVARVLNIPDYGYFRRKRLGSLTTNPDTGLDSPARQTLIQQCKERALENRTALKEGKPPRLAPLIRGEPVRLRHILGPKLSCAWE